MNYIAYEGKTVAFKEQADHQYGHVAVVDGDKLYISDGGELRIDTGISRKWNEAKGEIETIRTYDTPALWNFAPKVDVGVYKQCSGLPNLYANVDGALGTHDEENDY